MLDYNYEIVGCLSSSCVTLWHMSIGTGVVVAITLQQIDRTPDAKTGTESHDKGLKNGDCRVKKCHSYFLQKIDACQGLRASLRTKVFANRCGLFYCGYCPAMDMKKAACQAANFK